MRSKLTTLFAVIGAATVLVLAANTVALATTGNAILAGKINTASKMTSITRTTPGTGLQVKTKSTANSPLAVNGKGKVVNLNADKVDGLDGGTRALLWTSTGTFGSQKTFALKGLPVGKHLISYEAYMVATENAAIGNCYLSTQIGGAGSSNYRYAAESSAPYAFGATSTSGSGYIVQNGKDITSLVCRVTVGTWSAGSAEPVRITAIPLAGVTPKSVARVANRAR